MQDFRRRDDQRRAAAYAEFFVPVTAQLAGLLVERLGRPGDVVIDAGCGDGTLSAALVRAGWRAVPVDYSPAMAILAAASARMAVVADAMRLPVRTASVPAVVSAFLLPHLADLRAGLSELRRVLRQGGRLVLATWEPAQLSPFTGLAVDVVRALAPDRADLLRELDQRASADNLAIACGEAGLRPQAVESVTLAATLPSVEQWWTGLLTASCGGLLASLLASLPAESRRTARAAFEAEAAAYRMGDGSVLVPASAVLVTATAVGCSE